MSKLNINFNEKSFSFDEVTLSEAKTSLKAHLSSAMSGSGAVINFDGVAYNIDSTKLSVAENNFASYLDTISDESHEALEGTGAEYYTLAPTALTFRSTEPLNEFSEVQINGVTVDSSNYTLEEGSTIVTLPIEYLKTLDVGQYDINVVSANKTVNGNFTVAAPELNEYGFYYNQPYTAYVDMLGCNIAFFAYIDGNIDVIAYGDANNIERCTYVYDNNIITASTSMGDFTFSVLSDGLYCNELFIAFRLDIDAIVADKDYIYIKEDDGFVLAYVIDKNKASYGIIRSNINGLPTVAIDNYAFQNCVELKKIIIPDTVRIVYAKAFENCNKLTSVIFGENSELEIIATRAFASCNSLTNITIPNSVTDIGEAAFTSCNSLLYNEYDNAYYLGNESNPYLVLRKAKDYYINYCNINEYTKIIYANAFLWCENLTNITFSGTKLQWNAIPKGTNWASHVPATRVHCIDGDVAL